MSKLQSFGNRPEPKLQSNDIWIKRGSSFFKLRKHFVKINVFVYNFTYEINKL